MKTTNISLQPIVSDTSLIILVGLGLLLLLSVIVSFLYQKKGLQVKYLYLSITSVVVIAILFVGSQYLYQNNQNELIVQQIEKTHNVSQLTKTENQKFLCNGETKGTLSAATWKTGKKQQVGVIVAKKEKDRCVYSLKSVG